MCSRIRQNAGGFARILANAATISGQTPARISARCINLTRLPRRRRQPPMFMRQPASVGYHDDPAKPVLSMNAALSVTMAPLMPG